MQLGSVGAHSSNIQAYIGEDVKFVKWVPQSYTLLSCGYDDTIRIWNQEEEDWSSNDKDILKQHEGTVWCLDLYDDLMVSVSDDLSVNVWKQYSSDDDTKSLGFLLL